jgi:hypothetical protein
MERYGSSLSLNIPHDHLHGGERGEQKGSGGWMDEWSDGRKDERINERDTCNIVSCEREQFAVLSRASC